MKSLFDASYLLTLTGINAMPLEVCSWIPLLRFITICCKESNFINEQIGHAAPMAVNFIAVKPVLWDTPVQGTLPFSGHKIWPRKNVHIIFVPFISTEETPPESGERDTFSVSRSPGLT